MVMTNEHDREIVLNQIVDKLKEIGKLPESWDKPTKVELDA